MTDDETTETERLRHEVAVLRRKVAALEAALRHGPAPADHALEPFGLSPREAEVLDRIGRGENTREIAEGLYLSVNSVKSHTRNLFRKLGVTSRTEAAVLYHQVAAAGVNGSTAGREAP